MKRYNCEAVVAPLGTNYWRTMDRREIAGTEFAAAELTREYFESAGFKVRRVTVREAR
jgi:hypothetical protein